MRHTQGFRQILYRVLSSVNRALCWVMYGVRAPGYDPIPKAGPVLVVCNHASYADPLVLLATARRPISFLMAEEIFARWGLRWVFEVFGAIPVRRGFMDVGAVRAMLGVLAREEVVGIFPEGGIDRHRDDMGHLGIGYLALKSGAPVVPAAIVWEFERPDSIPCTLLTPCKALVRYGAPLRFERERKPDRDRIRRVTMEIMGAIRELQEAAMVKGPVIGGRHRKLTKGEERT